LLLYGVMFKCIVPALYLGALLSSTKGNPSRNASNTSNTNGSVSDSTINSDHLRMLGLISAFHQLSMNTSNAHQLYGRRKQFCLEHQLILDAMVEIVDVTYGDLVEELVKLHYLSGGDRDQLKFKGQSTRGSGSSRQLQSQSQLESVECNRNGSNSKLIVALLTVGLYPNIAFKNHPKHLWRLWVRWWLEMLKSLIISMYALYGVCVCCVLLIVACLLLFPLILTL